MSVLYRRASLRNHIHVVSEVTSATAGPGHFSRFLSSQEWSEHEECVRLRMQQEDDEEGSSSSRAESSLHDTESDVESDENAH